MTPKDQDRLFKLTREHFPDWSTKQVSGYVHGVADSHRRKEPRRVYIRGVNKVRSAKLYALGYIYGFIDAYGGDAYFTPWWKDIEIPLVLDYQWWRHAEQTPA